MIDDDLHSNVLTPDTVRGSATGRTEKRAPLVNNTKSRSTPENTRFFRARRFVLKSVVNEILPNSRTSKCMKYGSRDRDVEIWKGTAVGVSGKAFYKNLFVCGSLWTCPVCAAKISERRRVELASALAEARKLGASIFLLTQTIRHGTKDSLGKSLEGISKAEKLFWSGRAANEFRSDFKVVGTIKTTEVTWGQANGWHPHKHTLLILAKSVTPEQVHSALASRWIEACKKSGLPAPDLEHGLNVQDGSFADNYVSKWGLESEMTKGHSKIAKNGGMTPFALLDDYLETSNPQSRELFKEYAFAFRGKRQLVWSRYLRGLLLPNVDEQSDQEVAQSSTDDVQAILWAKLNIYQWRALKYFKYESLALDKAEVLLSPADFKFWLDSVTDSYRDLIKGVNERRGREPPAEGPANE